MSLRAKLVTTIAALCMVICLLSVGVWAATKTSVNISGTVSFVAEDINATVTATVTGATGNQNITDVVIAKFLGDEEIPEGSDYYEYEDEQGNKTYDFEDLDFASKKSVIVITLTIKNDSKQRKLKIDSFTATLGTGATPSTLTADVPAEDAEETFAGSNVVAWITAAAPTTEIAPEGSATVAISLRVANTNLKVDAAPFAGVLKLSNAGE